jgi:hypothetical protein
MMVNDGSIVRFTVGCRDDSTLAFVHLLAERPKRSIKWCYFDCKNCGQKIAVQVSSSDFMRRMWRWANACMALAAAVLGGVGLSVTLQETEYLQYGVAELLAGAAILFFVAREAVRGFDEASLGSDQLRHAGTGPIAIYAGPSIGGKPRRHTLRSWQIGK